MMVCAGSILSISVIPKSKSSMISDNHNCVLFWNAENAGMSIEWIAEGLTQPGKSKSGLAKAMGKSPSAVTDLLQGRRSLKVQEVAAVAAYLGVKPPAPEAGPVTVPLVGYVGAGAEAVLYSEGQGPFDEVPAPDGATKDTVCVEIRGTSLGELFDSWLVYYDAVQDPPGGHQIGKLCVCGLADGRILVKKLKRGQLPGHFTLLSNTEAPLYDQLVDWAAIVKSMTPR